MVWGSLPVDLMYGDMFVEAGGGGGHCEVQLLTELNFCTRFVLFNILMPRAVAATMLATDTLHCTARETYTCRNAAFMLCSAALCIVSLDSN
jgi:hypothetical protein